MYINLKYLAEQSMGFEDLFILQLAKQQKFEDCSEWLSFYNSKIPDLEKLGYIEYIKGNKSDSALSKMRISKAGQNILDNVEIAEITENDIKLFEWIKKIYLSRDKKLGNQRKTKLYIALFRTQSGINLNKLATLMNSFISDDQNMEYNHILEYALFKPANIYNTKFNLDESRLYQYYLSHQDHFDKIFENL
jgi:hypothetical protein